MEIWGYVVPAWVIGPLLLFGAIGLQIYLAKSDADEKKRNEEISAPPDHQVRWHIEHVRQDLRLIAILLFAILLTMWLR